MKAELKRQIKEIANDYGITPAALIEREMAIFCKTTLMRKEFYKDYEYVLVEAKDVNKRSRTLSYEMRLKKAK